MNLPIQASILSALFLVGGLPAVYAQTPSAPRFGIAELGAPERLCASFEGEELVAGQRLWLVTQDPPRVIAAQLLASREEPCRDNGFQGRAYGLRLERPQALDTDVALAVIGERLRPVLKEDEIVLQRQRGKSLFFEQCTGVEGVHYFVLEGDEVTWHTYYSLGYEIEPTCSDEELEALEEA